jgi:Silicon transporter
MIFSVGKKNSDKKSGHNNGDAAMVDESEDLKATAEPPAKSQANVLFFWLRILLSVVIILGISFAVTITALVRSETKMWDGVPIPVSIIFFFLLMMVVGILEGLQIALFAVIRRTDLEQDHHMAHKICQLVFSDPKNLPAFLVGQQILVTCCMFIVARITAVNVDLETGTNIFGVSDNLQNFFNTGLLGAVITTIIASLIWRIIASSYPVAFLSNPIPYVLIRICLFLEKSGICSSAWILAYGHEKLMNYHEDVVNLGDQQENTDDDEVVADETV